MSFCPFMSVIPERSTPELQRLQASLASEMSYRRAADILRRLLPISSNHATVRNRTMRVGERLQAAGHCPAEVTEPGSPEVKKAEVTLTIDGGFVRSKPDVDSRNFEILVGRIVRPGEKPYVFSWVRSEVASMPENLIDVLRAKTAAPMPQVSVITDGGNGVQHLHRLLPGKVRSILDWFHISMRVRYLEQIVAGLLQRTETEHYAKRLLGELVSKLRWHFWHANAEKAVDKMWRILTVCRIVVPETAGFKERLEHLDWRVREFFEYLDNNKGTLLNYGKRHREGKPISTAMAESAVNQVINARMCKRQQMRWSPRGAHLLAQVRCAVINGDLAVRLRRWPPPPSKAEASIHPALMEAPIA
jgi:negative regulator of replication initiation